MPRSPGWLAPMLLVAAACSGGGAADPTSTLPAVATTTTVPPAAERVVRYDLRLDEGETRLRTTLTGSPGESVILLGDGTTSAPEMRLLDGAGRELAAGRVDDTFPDLADLAYEFTSSNPIRLEMDATDGQRFRLRIDASAGVVPTLVDGTRSQVPRAGEYLYRTEGDVLVISTSAALDGAVELEQVDGDARFSQAAVDLVAFPPARWFVRAGTYRVTVDGRVGAVSISSDSSGLVSAAATVEACGSFRAIERSQLEVGAALAPVSELIARSLSGGTLDGAWLEDLKGAVEEAEPAVEALNREFDAARSALPLYFTQDLVDLQNGLHSSWTRLHDAAAGAASPRRFFELVAGANDARLLRIGQTAGYSLANLDAFTAQVCGFSIRTAAIGIEA